MTEKELIELGKEIDIDRDLRKDYSYNMYEWKVKQLIREKSY